MTFASDLRQFAKKAEARSTAVFHASVAELRDSVVKGSAVTGAPALPIAPTAFPRAGALRESVTVSYPDPNTAHIYTTSPYAIDVEENPKGHSFNEGGPHGWALTAAAGVRVIETATKRIAGYER
jgi:hypothetical protein